MKKIAIAGIIIAGMVVGASSAQAVTLKEAQYLQAIKNAKISNLKKNTNIELLNIGKTLCLDVTYSRDGLAKIYKDNRFKWNPKTQPAFSKIAREYLCPKKIAILNPDGTYTEVKVYDEPQTVIWVDAN